MLFEAGYQLVGKFLAFSQRDEQIRYLLKSLDRTKQQDTTRIKGIMERGQSFFLQLPVKTHK
jgi:hypothetical protein